MADSPDPSSISARPQRVVSMNLCTDELLLALADPDQILSVTWLVKNPDVSWSAAAAEGIPSNRGLVEEIVPLKPDLVITGAYTTPVATDMLRRLQVPVLELDIPANLTEVYVQIRTLAAALGRQARGEELIATMQERLSGLDSPIMTDQPSAAVYQPNGFTVGAGSLIHELLQAAGLRNFAVEQNLDRYGFLTLEELIYQRPDLLIMNRSAESLPSLAHELLNHPALGKAFDSTATVTVPPQAWSCGGAAIVDAVEVLEAAARLVVANPS